MTNRFGTASDFSDGDILFSADLSDSFNNLRYVDTYLINPTSSTIVAIVAHSATQWTSAGITGSVYNTQNTGSSWTLSFTSGEETFLRLCKSTLARAVVVDEDDTAPGTTINVRTTSDSGATWTLRTAADFDEVYDVSFSVPGRIVIAGDDVGAGVNNIVYSTDDGVTWNDPVTVPGVTVAVDMVNNLIGYALDDTGAIWKTSDGAVNWTNTTHAAGGGLAKTTMYAITETLVIFVGPHADNYIETYDNTANITRRARPPTNSDTAVFIPGGIEVTSNDEIYVLFGRNGNDGGAIVMKSVDSGVTWQTFPWLPATDFVTATTKNIKCKISEAGTNRVLVSTGSHDLFRLNAT